MKRFKGGSISSHETQRFVEQSYLKNSQRDDAVGAFHLDRALSNDRAAVYYNQATNNALIVNRGTTGTLQDWSNNVSLATGQYADTERMKHALDTQLAVRAKYPGWKITNVAHSQSQAIVTNLNAQGLTDEVITLNGATMPWDVQANNETRIRSSADLVSGFQVLQPTRRRNKTIQHVSFNPLSEHSANILERLNPITVFGRGFIKTYYY